MLVMHLFDEVGILIGGQLIDRHYGLWMEIWNELTVPESKKKGYDNMIGYRNRKDLPYGAVTKKKITNTSTIFGLIVIPD